MAVVKVYIGPDGNDANDGSTRALRVQSKARAKALIAAIGGGNTARLMGEGTFYRSVTGWGTVGGTFLDLLSSDTNMQGVRVSATITEDAAAPAFLICDYRLSTNTANWTDTGTTTTRGTKIWVFTGAAGSATGGGRAWGSNWLNWTTDKAARCELWEGGANDTATFTNIHPNLDIVPKTGGRSGDCWTWYNAAGTLTADLYIACDQNPVTRYGAISFSTRESFAIMSLSELTEATVDPEVTLRGGGTYGLYVTGCGSTTQVTVEPATVGFHAFGQPVAFDGATRNIYWSPAADPEYAQEVPYYPASATGHNVGSNQCEIKSTCEMAAATGWPEFGGIPGLIVNAVASNGRRSNIRDLFHSGICDSTPTGGRVHQFIRCLGVEASFDHVKYGRFWAGGASNGSMRDVIVAFNNVRNQPTQSQMNGGPRMFFVGNTVTSKPNIGNGYVGPWGTTSNKAGTSIGLAVYTGTGVDMIEVYVLDNWFECEDGGLTADTFNSVAWLGNLYVANNIFVRPGKPGYSDNFVDNRMLGFSWLNASDQAKMRFHNNVAVGYAGNCVRRFQTSPSINDATTIALFLPATQSTGWQTYPDLEAFRKARHQGSLPHLV